MGTLLVFQARQQASLPIKTLAPTKRSPSAGYRCQEVMLGTIRWTVPGVLRPTSRR